MAKAKKKKIIKTSKKASSTKRNIFSRIYNATIGGVVAELKKVTWTKPSDLVGLIVFVLVICIIFAAVMMALDFFFIQLRDFLLEL